MKKFLSLVLALVMTMSLVTVSAGAADFTDDSKITYKEAVDVMTALGVVGGYADGSFNPNGTLTRGAAAKIICNLILGTTASEALVANVAPYSDVPTDNVFAGYIAYLAKEGVVGGYADGTFKPAATLTGYAFMKMLLGVIGLNADTEGYNEANWSVSVAKRALSEGVKLTEGLKGEFNGTKAVTREEACLYAFNAIQAETFSYSSTITIGNVTVGAGKAEQDGDVYYTDIFTKLEKSTKAADKVDEFGRPATTWLYDGDKIGTYADEADYVYVLDDDYTGYTSAATLLKDVSDEDIAGVVGGGKTNYYVNGVGTTNNSAFIAAANYGTTVEVYVNDNDYATSVVAYYYQVAEIEDIDDEVSKTDAKNDVTCYVGLEGFSEDLKDTKIAGFDAKTYVEDAVIAYIYNGEKIIASNVAESVEGKLTTVKGDDYVTIDGTKYYAVKAAVDFDECDAGDTWTLYLDNNGNVIGVEEVEEAAVELDAVYYVASTWYESAKKYGNTTYTYYAQLVAMDGTVSEVKTEALFTAGSLVTLTDKKETITGTIYESGADGDTKKDNQSVSCKKDDEKYVLNAWDNDDYSYNDTAAELTKDLAKNDTRYTIGSTLYRLNSSTKYILVEASGSDLEVTVKTGGIALDVESDDAEDYTAIVVTEDGSKVALYVIVISDEIEEATTFNSENVVYIKSLSSEKGDGYRMQTVYLADGSTAEWKVAEDQYDLTEGKFYEYDTNDDGYYELNLATALDKSKVEKGIWDDEEGVLYSESYTKGCLYEDLLTVSGVADIDVSKAAFVDLHDTDAAGQYTKTVKSLTALDNLFEKDGYTTSATLNLSVSEDGAVLIVVIALTHNKT